MTYVRVMILTTCDLCLPTDMTLGCLHTVGEDPDSDYCIVDMEVDVKSRVAGLPEQQL